MLSTFLTWNRRRWHSELAVGSVPDRAEPRDAFAEADLRGSVLQALDALPSRQRAVIVLRFFDDLTEVQAAEALGCSVGTVKSQTSKALARLRGCAPLRGLLSEEERHEIS
jgi:RNA polymerase sigma factor (sigma-70 family)